MKKIQLWSVDRTEGKLSATAVESVDNTKTEQDLEELLVASPDLLMNGLTLIGRRFRMVELLISLVSMPTAGSSCSS